MTDFETLYWLVFLSFVLALLALERVAVLQRAPVRIALRWGSNVGLFLIGGLVSALLLPIGIYAFAAQQPQGAMTGLGVPFAAQILVTFLLLDLWKYGEHRLFHAVPLLWRCHLVHHSDTDVDVTTTERHHPLEVLIGAGVLIALVALLRPPAAALGLYLLMATGVALYSHANLRLPAALDRVLGRVLVTPSVHAVHHSSLRCQTDSNFGMVLTLWDRLFGTFVDPSRTHIAHFGLEYFHRPDDTRLWRVLQQPFRFRRGLEYPPRMAASGPRAAPEQRVHAAPLAPHVRVTLLAGLAGVVLLVFATWPTLPDMARTWSSGDAYQYAWLVVPMLVYVMAWHHDEGLGSLDPRPAWSGLWIAAAGAIGWGVSRFMSLDVGQQLGLVVAVQGVALSTLGWASYRKHFHALALLFLLIPAGDLLQPALRAFTVKAIEGFTWAAGIPHSVDGFVVHIGTHRYIVVDECSGLAYVTFGLFLGYSFGLLLYRSALRAGGMALLGAVLGVASNAIRVNAIVLVDWLRGSQMDLSAHATLQWIMLLATLAALLYVLSRAQPAPATVRATTAAGDRPPARDDRPHTLAPLASGLAGALIAAVVVMQMRGEPAATSPVAFPDAVSGWQRLESVSWRSDAAGRTASTRATYGRGDRRLEVIVIRAEGVDAKPSEAMLAPGDRSVWREKQAEREVVCAGRDCVAVRHLVWVREHRNDLRHAYVAYDIDGSITDSRLVARARHGWQKFLGRTVAPVLLGVTVDAALEGEDVVRLMLAMRASAHEGGE